MKIRRNVFFFAILFFSVFFYTLAFRGFSFRPRLRLPSRPRLTSRQRLAISGTVEAGVDIARIVLEETGVIPTEDYPEEEE